MRYHFFVHHEWILQNLGKEAVRTNMHTTVRVGNVEKKNHFTWVQDFIHNDFLVFHFQIAMDGGSPLACKKGENHYELGGLVTFGTSCSHDQSPSLFTNVSKHIKWIKENYDIMKRKRTE